jgi:hypothetical protein
LFFKSSEFNLRIPIDIRTVFHNLAGITEEHEDSNYIISSSIYTFKGKINYDSFCISMFWNRGEYVINGIVNRIDNNTILKLNIMVSKFTKVSIIIVFLFLFIIFISNGLNDAKELFYILGGLIATIILTFRFAKIRIKKIFNKIINDDFSKTQLKYSHMN